MNLLKFILNNQLTIISNKTPDEVMNLLKSDMNAKSPFFKGDVSNYEFDIHRKFGKFERNSFVPIIKGKITEHPQGAEIKIVMRLHLFVIAFLLFFIYDLLKVILGGFAHHNYAPILFLGVFSFLCLIFWQIYSNEVDEATTFLKRLFVK